MSTEKGFGYSEQGINDLFDTHDLDTDTKVIFAAIKGLYKQLALQMLSLVPACNHQTRAINMLLRSKDAACIGLITQAERAKRTKESLDKLV